jgi:hypothetical protein
MDAWPWVALGSFGRTNRLHSAKILRLSQDLPVVIEIVDAEDRIEAFLEVLDGMMAGGLVTLERVQVGHYGAAAPSPDPPPEQSSSNRWQATPRPAPSERQAG